MSTLEVAAGAIRRDEAVEIVLLLAFAGGSCLVVLLRCEAPHREVTR
jgi:hypothetical protein